MKSKKARRPNGFLPKEEQELVDYFARSQKQEKAYALLEKRFVFDTAIEACPAPSSIYN
uniref:Uncharacterized protein n=1 Tax=Moniliophthora roreri TaxID=221103 RepID=A0A0W0FGD5_MONRR